MSWTDSDTIKKHLLDLDRLPGEHRDVPVAIGVSGEGLLPHRGVVEGSEKVKRIAALAPTSQSGVQLTGEVWKQLQYDNLLPGGMAVAEDEGLKTVYRLDIDYAVKSAEGKLRRIEGGAISDGQSVQLYYRRYQVMTRETDYIIDYAEGKLTLVTSGDLEPDTTVWVDYAVSAASGADQVIAEAITEGEDKILARLKSGYSADSGDQGLKTGGTELSLAAVCRALATRALSDGAPSAEARARGWRDLADVYETVAWRTLKPFLASPAPVHGGRRPNQSWEWA